MPTAAVGRPSLDPWMQPSIDLFCNTHVLSPSATHVCMCLQQQSLCQRFFLIGKDSIVECSEPSLGFFIGLFCNTHVCVHSSTCSTKPQFSSAATHVCVLTAAIGLPKSLKESKLQLTCSAPDMCIFRNAHVYAHKQHLVGQPLTLGCNPQWTASETHMCVCSQQQLVC